MFDEIPSSAALQKEIHDGSRLPRPEWMESAETSSIGDSYEERFVELLQLFLLGEDQSAASPGQAPDKLMPLTWLTSFPLHGAD